MFGPPPVNHAVESEVPLSLPSAGKKVLVVEADEIVLVLISHILARNEFTVHWARDVRAAAALIAGGRYDVAVVDETLFDEVIVAQAPQLLPFTILLTCSTDVPAHGASVHSVLKKPVEIGALLEAVNAVNG